MMDITLSLPSPMTLLNSVAKGGKGDALRKHLVFEGLEKLIRAAATDEPVKNFDADVLRRLPEILPKLGGRSYDRPNLRSIVLGDPRLCVHALQFDFQKWRAEAAPLVLGSPELTYHFLRMRNGESQGDESDLAPFRETLRKAPFWLARLAKATGALALLSLISEEIEDSSTKSPYCLLHYFLSHPEESCEGAWPILFSDPVVAVLSARFLGERAFPWDYFPFSSLKPRDALNMIKLWPCESVPARLWETLMDDPEWFVEAWTTVPQRRPGAALAAELLKKAKAHHGDAYALAGAFCEWWRRNLTVAKPTKASDGSQDEGMLR